MEDQLDTPDKQDDKFDLSLSFTTQMTGISGASNSSIILTGISKHTEHAKKFGDQNSGPYFSDIKDLLYNNGIQKTISLDDIIKLIVATIRIIPIATAKFLGYPTRRNSNLFLIKEVMSFRLAPNVIEQPPTKKRKVIEKEPTIGSNCSYNYVYENLFQHPVFSLDKCHNYISVGQITLNLPVSYIVNTIADRLCEYKFVQPNPIPIQNSIHISNNPFTLFSFPFFAISETLISEFSKPDQTNNSFKHPKPEYYEPIVKHLREILCDNDVASYTLIETWLSEMFFDPATKYPLCPIFTGPQGVGKNMFFEFITRFIIGQSVSASPSSLAQFVGRFNSMAVGMILFVVSEDNLNTDPKNVQALKTICTEQFHCIEAKYQDIRTNVQLFVRTCILTNDPNPYKALPPGERRFIIVNTRNFYENQAYFKKMNDIMLNSDKAPLYAMHFLGYLYEIRKKTKDAIGALGCFSNHTDIICQCKLNHMYYHKDGYSTDVLRSRPITKHMAKNYISSMCLFNFFLLVFVVMKFKLSDILPSMYLDQGYSHIALDDLCYIDSVYFNKSWEIFRKVCDRMNDTGVSNSLCDVIEGVDDIEFGYSGEYSVDISSKQSQEEEDEGNNIFSWFPKQSNPSPKNTTDIVSQLTYFVGAVNDPIGSCGDNRKTRHQSIKGPVGGIPIEKKKWYYNLSGTKKAFMRDYGPSFGSILSLVDGCLKS